MSDDWHLCSEETPPEDGVYYTFIIFEGSYIYGYKAYSGGFWWCWQDYKWVKKKDLVVAGWSIISSEMKATDKCLPERLTLRGILGQGDGSQENRNNYNFLGWFGRMEKELKKAIEERILIELIKASDKEHAALILESYIQQNGFLSDDVGEEVRRILENKKDENNN